MDKDFGQRKVQITRSWAEMIKPLYDRSKEDYELFYMACLGYALRAEQYGDEIGFGNSELQGLLQRTYIQRWTPDRPALIDIKMDSDV